MNIALRMPPPPRPAETAPVEKVGLLEEGGEGELTADEDKQPLAPASSRR